jgi:hypothetical protein
LGFGVRVRVRVRVRMKRIGLVFRDFAQQG